VSAATDLYWELSSIGVIVWHDAGRLRYRAPAHVLNAVHLAAMKALKPELLQLLLTVPVNDSASEHRAIKGTTVPLVFILTYEVDGKQATCRDPLSVNLAEALTAMHAMYGLRLGRVWYQGKLVHDKV